jgi:hypothetical protein
MAAEGPSSFEANPKRQACSRSVGGRIVEMADNFSSSISISSGWTDLINFVKNMIAEIFGIKMIPFWKNLDEGETERGLENGEHSFGLLKVCLDRIWSSSSFGNPCRIGIDSKIERLLVTH